MTVHVARPPERVSPMMRAKRGNLRRSRDAEYRTGAF
jgi:hypothetical protein